MQKMKKKRTNAKHQRIQLFRKQEKKERRVKSTRKKMAKKEKKTRLEVTKMRRVSSDIVGRLRWHEK